MNGLSLAKHYGVTEINFHRAEYRSSKPLKYHSSLYIYILLKCSVTINNTKLKLKNALALIFIVIHFDETTQSQVLFPHIFSSKRFTQIFLFCFFLFLALLS